MRVVHSLFLCYVVKLTYFTAGEGSDSVFSGRYMSTFSGFRVFAGALGFKCFYFV